MLSARVVALVLLCLTLHKWVFVVIGTVLDQSIDLYARMQDVCTQKKLATFCLFFLIYIYHDNKEKIKYIHIVIVVQRVQQKIQKIKLI